MLRIVPDLPAGRGPRRQLATRIDDLARSRAPDLPKRTLVLRRSEEVRVGFPLLPDVVAEGRIVRDRHGRVADLRAQWRQRLAAQGARRVSAGASWHWDLAGSRPERGWRL
jgi:hypothetical protein